MDLCNMARLWIALVWALNFVRLSLSDGEAEAVKSWMPRPHRNRAMMQKVEKQLMRLFGFKRKVNPRETLHIPEHMWTMYRKWSGELHDDTDKMSNVFRILHHDGEFSTVHKVPIARISCKACILFEITERLFFRQSRHFLIKCWILEIVNVVLGRGLMTNCLPLHQDWHRISALLLGFFVT